MTPPLTSVPTWPRFRWKWARLIAPLSLLVGVGLWEMISWRYPPFILPSPFAVWQRFWVVLGDGSLVRHTQITLLEVLTGLFLGAGLAIFLGYGLAKSRSLERALAPYIVASQAVPIVAIAPLLIIWFGPDITSKIFICALVVFFPILISVVGGLRSVETDLRDLMRSLRATRWQTFIKLEVPAALPIVLGGLKVGATLSVIGAVVGEFVGADRGLGFLINFARGQYDTPLVFVGTFTLITVALILYSLIAALEKLLLAWKETKS